MKNLLLTITLVACALTAKAQAPITVTNLGARFQWDASISPNIIGYDVYITTNQLWFTNNSLPVPSSVIIGVGVPGNTTTVGLTNVWPGMTNGTYSAFADAKDASGATSVWSPNVVFRVAIAPQPPRNMRVIPLP